MSLAESVPCDPTEYEKFVTEPGAIPPAVTFICSTSSLFSFQHKMVTHSSLKVKYYGNHALSQVIFFEEVTIEITDAKDIILKALKLVLSFVADAQWAKNVWTESGELGLLIGFWTAADIFTLGRPDPVTMT